MIRQPDWQRNGVVEMTHRALKALAAAEASPAEVQP
jgi:hypothetical protein